MPISFYSVDLHSKKILPVIYSGILMKEMLEFLSHAESSTIYHHPAWLQALSIESNQEAFYIIQRNNKGEIVLILPLLKTRGIPCLLYTSDAADERSSVDLGGRRIIKKKNIEKK